jgi:hypothetical protein
VLGLQAYTNGWLTSDVKAYSFSYYLGIEIDTSIFKIVSLSSVCTVDLYSTSIQYLKILNICNILQQLVGIISAQENFF